MAELIVIEGKEYIDDGIYERMYLYITNPKKAISGLVGSSFVYIGNGAVDVGSQMRMVSNSLNGNKKGQVLRHFVLSFDRYDEDCITPMIAYQIAERFVNFFDGFQTVFAVHENTENLHIHFMVCSTNFYTGHKFVDKRETYNRIAYLCPAVIVQQHENRDERIFCNVIYSNMDID